MFSFVTPEQPKKLALMPVKLLNQILKTTEEGKQSLRKNTGKYAQSLEKEILPIDQIFKCLKAQPFLKAQYTLKYWCTLNAHQVFGK